MTKLLKLKNKPFWIVTAIILLIGITIYSQTRMPREGFQTVTMYNWVGMLWHGSLSDISGIIQQLGSVLDASNGEIIWQNGNSKPSSTDAKL